MNAREALAVKTRLFVPETNDDETGAAIRPESDVEGALAKNPTESNLALAFTHRMQGRLLYCAEFGGWLEWSGTHWRRDKVRRAYNYCVRFARALPTGGKSAGRASFAKGVETIASAEPAFARTIDQFDQDRDLIATPAGTINLRTGVMNPARPEDMISRCTAASPENGRPKAWLQFLAWALDGDQERIDFLQEFIGYSLTGHTGAEVFVYFDGPGGNGKGCITNTLRLIAGDYYHGAPANLLLYSSLPQHPTSMAALNGKRIVVASELPVGARLDEQRLKMVTGQDPVCARFMNRDETTFMPELKLMIAANHQPRIIRPDAAMHRRLRVISMPHVAENPNPALKNVILPAEAGQIFAWAIEGAARILARGEVFNTPEKVLEDSQRYLGSQDSLGLFINERCDLNPSIHYPRTGLYDAYREWADESGEFFTMAAREFYAELEGRGLKPATYSGVRSLKGIALKGQQR